MKNKTKWALLLTLLAWLTLAPITSLAEEKKFAPPKNNSVKIEYLPNWIFNGNEVYRNATQISLTHNFPSLKGLSLTSFNSLNENKKFTENDFTLGYSKSFEDVSFFGGITSINPRGFSGDWEIYIGAIANKIPLSPTISYSKNIDERSGVDYTTFSLGKNVNMKGKNLSLVGRVGFNNNYSSGENGLHNAEFEAKLKLPLGKSEIYLNPKVNYSIPLDRTNRQRKFYGGISLVHKF